MSFWRPRLGVTSAASPLGRQNATSVEKYSNEVFEVPLRLLASKWGRGGDLAYILTHPHRSGEQHLPYGKVFNMEYTSKPLKRTLTLINAVMPLCLWGV